MSYGLGILLCERDAKDASHENIKLVSMLVSANQDLAEIGLGLYDSRAYVSHPSCSNSHSAEPAIWAGSLPTNRGYTGVKQGFHRDDDPG
jgi:hypothetical protein